MAITVNWITKVIYVPRNDMVLVQSSPNEIRQLDLNFFRLVLKDLEDDDGMPFLDTHSHTTEVTIGGVTLARVISIINGYSVTFEDGQYAVNLTGANSNVADVVNLNQVSVRSGNSAGLVTNQAIEFGEYGGAVTIDVLNGYSGTIYPTGTLRRPVNNIPDAVLIATFRGFNIINVIGDITLGSMDIVDNFILNGENPSKTNVIVDALASVINIEIQNSTVSGVFDGYATFTDSHLIDIEFVNSTIRNCVLEGTIKLSGSGQTTLFSCSDGLVNLGPPPEIDFNGSSQSLAIREYNGDLVLSGKTGPEDVEINISTGGTLRIEPTVSNGTFRLSGILSLVDNSTGLAVIDTSSVIFPDKLQLSSFHGAVHIDTNLSTSGVLFPAGTKQHPVSNLSDALSIAAARGLDTLSLSGHLVLGSTDSVDNMKIVGSSTLNATVSLQSGCSTIGTEFFELTLTGSLGGSILARSVILKDVSNIGSSTSETFFDRCLLLDGDMVLNQSPLIKDIYFVDCISGAIAQRTVNLDMNSSDANVIIRGYTGNIIVENWDQNQETTFGFKDGQLTLLPSCSSGKVNLDGILEVIDNSDPSFIVNDRSRISPYNIADAVYEEALTSHTDESTFGGFFQKLLTLVNFISFK